MVEEGRSPGAAKCKKPLFPISQRGKGKVTGAQESGSPEEARTITGLSLGAGAMEDV